MTWVKICGLTNLGDALSAIEAGADAVGFVFYEKSPRYVDPQTARDIVAALPEKPEKVGVFAEMPKNVLDIVRDVGLTAIQCRLGTQGSLPHDGKAVLGRPVRMVVTLSVTRLLQNEKKLQGLTAEFFFIVDFAENVEFELRRTLRQAAQILFR